LASLNQRIEALRAQGRQVIRLDVGSPDGPPPQAVVDRLRRAAALPDRHGYQGHKGPRTLRQAWADMYQRVFEVDLDPDREVLPLLGSKEGIFHISMALLKAGDVVLVPDPGYPTYRTGAQYARGEVHLMPLSAERGYLPDLTAIPAQVARRARLMWLNYPNNPTGATADLAFMHQAVAFAHHHGILLCHDAAYSRIAEPGYRPPSMLQVPGAKEVVVEFNSLSKSHNMAGWRLGAALGNPHALQTLLALKTHADSGHFLPIMEAAAEALKGDRAWIEALNARYTQRRALVVQALRALNITLFPARASIYLWFPIPRGFSSLEFTSAVLDQAGISLAPGSIFGGQGEGFARIALTVPQEALQEAMGRLSRWWQEHAGEGA
jgi:LL-diaminopimelate aminotransferase